jgi:DNA-binding MarR family transcriptional regulator
MHSSPGSSVPKRVGKKTQAAPQAQTPDGTPDLAHMDLSAIHNSVGYHLRRAQVAEFQAFAGIFGAFEIRPVQYAILAILHDNPGLKQAQIGEALNIKRANQVALIDELEERGLVARRHRADDRRSHALHLTAAGRKLTKKLLALHAKHEAQIAEQLGAKGREQLLSLLRQFLQAAAVRGLIATE